MIERLKDICAQNRVKLIFIDSEHDLCNLIGDNRCVCSFEEIMVGHYENETLMALSVLHEIGHLMVEEYLFQTKISMEIECWAIAFRLAKKYGIEYDAKEAKWCIDNLKSYCTEECLGLKEK